MTSAITYSSLRSPLLLFSRHFQLCSQFVSAPHTVVYGTVRRPYAGCRPLLPSIIPPDNGRLAIFATELITTVPYRWILDTTSTVTPLLNEFSKVISVGYGLFREGTKLVA